MSKKYSDADGALGWTCETCGEVVDAGDLHRHHKTFSPVPLSEQRILAYLDLIADCLTAPSDYSLHARRTRLAELRRTP